MRIAYVVSLFPKLSETFILREIVELRARGHDVVVFSMKRGAEPMTHPEAAALAAATFHPSVGFGLAGALLGRLARRPILLASIVARVALAHAGRPSLLWKGLATIPAAVQLAARARRMGIEHLHAHWATWPALAAWIVSRLTGIPYSVTGHAHDLFLPNPMLARKVADARFFATISEFNRALLIQKCGAGALGKVRVIRCGLPLGSFPFEPGGARAPANPPLVVSVGRLVDYKGFDDLIRACAALRRDGLPVRCVIVGEGPLRESLERQAAAAGLGGSVEMAGERLQPWIQERLRGADLFVLASAPGADGQQDGIPIVLMEAMALGVPVVSTRLSGIPELVKDGVTGLLASPRDPERLAAAMRRLLEDRVLAASLSRQGRDLIEKEYDLARSVSLLCEAFGAGGARG